MVYGTYPNFYPSSFNGFCPPISMTPRFSWRSVLEQTRQLMRRLRRLYRGGSWQRSPNEKTSALGRLLQVDSWRRCYFWRDETLNIIYIYIYTYIYIYIHIYIHIYSYIHIYIYMIYIYMIYIHNTYIHNKYIDSHYVIYPFCATKVSNGSSWINNMIRCFPNWTKLWIIMSYSIKLILN